MLIKHDTPLADVAIADPSILMALSRLGIAPGLGEATAQTAAERVGLDVDLLLAILNTFVNTDYFPEHTLRLADPAQLVNYLTLTDSFYTRFQLPNIERHFQALMRSDRAPGSGNLERLKAFYDQAATTLCQRIDEDLTQLFPAVIAGSPDCMALSDEADPAELFEDLLTMLITHLHAECDPNLCYAVIVAVDALAADLRRTDRLRRRVLLPVCQKIAAG